MQYKIILLKIKSLQYPDKEWDNLKHFYMTTTGRKEEKLLKKAYRTYRQEELKSSDWNQKREIGYEIILDDNKTLMIFMKTRKEFVDFLWKYQFSPEIKRGSWDVEVLFETTIRANKKLNRKSRLRIHSERLADSNFG